jgi:hypothetical protein
VIQSMIYSQSIYIGLQITYLVEEKQGSGTATPLVVVVVIVVAGVVIVCHGTHEEW